MSEPPVDELVAAVQPLVDRLDAEVVPVAELVDGDIRLRWEGVVVAGVRLPPGSPAEGVKPASIEDIIADVERAAGSRLADLDRAGKQQAVRMLEERGAFTYRKAAETVADALGVTRFTVYNYLNRH